MYIKRSFVTVHNVEAIIFRRMVSSGMLRHVALVRTDVSEESSVSFIRVTRIGELGTTQAATSNRHTLQRNVFLRSVRRLLATAVETSNLPLYLVKHLKLNLQTS
jgi:hypothetical protein